MLKKTLLLFFLLFASFSFGVTTTDDHNAGWQTMNANLSLTCSPAGGTCYSTYYRVDGNDSFTAPFPYIWFTRETQGLISRINPITNLIDLNVVIHAPSDIGPTSVAIDANRNIWVSVYDDFVSRINPDSYSIDANINLDFNARAIAVDSNGNVWVPGNTPDAKAKVSRINPENNSVVTTIGLGDGHPLGIAIDSNGTVWVGNDAGFVHRINPISNRIDANISVSGQPYGVAVDSNSGVWVTRPRNNSISKIDSLTNEVVVTIDTGLGVGGTFPGEVDQPYGPAVDGNGNVWITNPGYSSVSRINSLTNEIDVNVSLGLGDYLDIFSLVVDSNNNIWVSVIDGNIFRINPVTNRVDANFFGNVRPETVSDNSGFALQNFVLSKGWRMYGGNNDSNILISADGNHKVEYYSMDINGLVESTNTIWVAVDKFAPVIAEATPNSIVFQSGTEFTFSIILNDGVVGSFGKGPLSRCDSNAAYNESPISGAQDFQTTPVSNGNGTYTCTRTFSFPNALAADRVDLNFNAMDEVGFTTGLKVMGKIVYSPSSGSPLYPSQPSGGSGGGGDGGVVGAFCLAQYECLSGLVCDTRLNRCVKEVEEATELVGVLISPSEISSDPFSDVLPGSTLVLQDIVLNNTTSNSFDFKGVFECSDERFCAKDWCVFSENSKNSIDFKLSPRGLRSFSIMCNVPDAVKVGEVYQFQIQFLEKVSNKSQAAFVLIPIRFGTGSSISDFTQNLGGVSFAAIDYGLLCFNPLKLDCLISAAPGSNPISVGGIPFKAITIGHAAITLSLLLFFVRPVLLLVPLALFAFYAWLAFF